MKEGSFTYREYLKPEIISTINNFELKAKMLVEGFLIGLNKSPYHGFSAEFNEHRAYFVGDSIKNIDWKLFGKTEKLFVKKYEEETNLITKIVVDCSKSMSFKQNGKISKFDYAKLIAAALSYLLTKQNDAVGISFFSENVILDSPAKTSKINLHKILSDLENQQVDKSTKISESLKEIASKIRKRSLVVIISDFFDDLDEILLSLKQFKYNKNEVILFQILDKSEIDFNFEDDSTFIDLENETQLNVQPQLLKVAYKRRFNDFQNRLKEESANFKIDFYQISTETPLDKALYLFFSKRQKMK